MTWLDHLTAILVGTVVVAIAAGVVLTRASTASEETQAYATEAARDAFVDQAKMDFENLGAGRLAGEAPVLAHDSTRVLFRTIADGAGSRATVEYRLVSADSSGAPPYHLERWADGVRAGGSAGLVRAFELGWVDAAGASVPFADPALRGVEVWIEWEVPYGGEHLPRLGWGSTIHPAPLRLAG